MRALLFDLDGTLTRSAGAGARALGKELGARLRATEELRKMRLDGMTDRAIARALLTGPDLLLLDEPSQGLAPLVVETVMGTIRELKRERVSMLLVEQNAEMALGLADRVYVIDHGTIVFEGTPKALRANEQITTTYLGVGG